MTDGSKSLRVSFQNPDHKRPHTSSSIVTKLVRFSKALDERTKAIKAELARNSFGEHDTRKLPIATQSVDDSDEEDKKADSRGTTRSAISLSPCQHVSKHDVSLLYYRQMYEDNQIGSFLWGTVKRGAIDVSTFGYQLWLFALSLTFLYNFWAITLRASFHKYQSSSLIAWLVCDYVCDLLVLCDVIFVKPRIPFYQNGLIVYDKNMLRRRYLTSRTFKLDIISLLPFDLCYFAVGEVQPLFRLNRLLSMRAYFELFDRLARNAAKPELFRMLKTIIYLLMTVHVYTCVYYAFSKQVIGIGKSSFVFEGGDFEEQAYSRCFFITFKMAARIGAQEKIPTVLSERLLITLFWLIALCVEVVLLAQVREIFLSITREDDEFGRLLSTALAYVRRYKCSEEIEKKVRDWFTYTRETQRILDEQNVAEMLPKYLRKDLALNIHYDVLSKVSIFENCEYAVLSDIVFKLKMVLYFPNEIIFSKGDVGKQMYIIEKGQAEVIDDRGNVAATLTEGAVFGELCLLSVGTARRNLTVRSKGYSNLFLLSRDDFQEIMTQHPKIYKRLLKKNNSTIGSINYNSPSSVGQQLTSVASAEPIVDVTRQAVRPDTPKIYKLLMKLLPRKSILRRMMKVHPSTSYSKPSVDSVDYDPEIAALDWSSPSPDKFYVYQEWELKHFKPCKAPDPDDDEDDVFVDASETMKASEKQHHKRRTAVGNQTKQVGKQHRSAKRPGKHHRHHGKRKHDQQSQRSMSAFQ